MQDFNKQLDYWNRVGPHKPFSFPVNVDRIRQLLPLESRILDFGCGYGRVLELLRAHGYSDLIGFDPATAMIAAARDRCPDIMFRELTDPPHLPLADASADAVLLFAVLTCVTTDAGQREIINEISRVLRPDGLVYVSDFWLQKDPRNLLRYEEGFAKYGLYGVFDLPEGVTVRHHDLRWIEELLSGYQLVALDEIQVMTMNGHQAAGFQLFGRRKV